ncbi:hypothetical protein [Pseudonocardia nigra]|uniref:hypothetical protein n=1 Tax=Pseudonocardia nigra TaxID=1921578 RepID=UPI001C604DB9|nr:hypothetical protein [Pseudonocardia nigra]
MTTTTDRVQSEARFERPPRRLTGPRRPLRDVELHYVANGLIGLIFAATGPSR